MPSPYPLTFEPLLFPKVWGGRRLEAVGKRLAAGTMIGESWEVADLGSTSVSGAGGGAAVSVIAGGALKGRTLNDAVSLWGAHLLGEAKPVPEGGGAGRFPLLVKYLDARENLSVQVHPSMEYARAHAGAGVVHVKTECWYVVEAEPGAVIYKGVREGVTRESFERHLREGDGSGVVGDLGAVPAVVGEMHVLPSGTVHALGAGVLVAEVQTPSDTTFRVYDWGRKGRELHVEEALECIHFGPARDATRAKQGGGAASTRLVSTGYFTVHELRVRAGESVVVGQGAAEGMGRCAVLMVVRGLGEVVSREGAPAPVAASIGATVLVPASIAAATEIRAAEEMRVLRAEVL